MEPEREKKMAGSASLTARLNDVAFPTGPEELQPSIAGLYLCVDVIYLFVFFRRGRGAAVRGWLHF